jgi:DNA-binding response OmpR family regulator
MKILIAEDEPVTRLRMEALLKGWGYDVTAVQNGREAWERLQHPGGPRLVITDWQMPEMTGDQLCRIARENTSTRSLYIIIFTASRVEKEDLVRGLGSGADDYLVKPVDPSELRARLRVGERVLALQSELEQRVHDLEKALREVQQLQDLLPICSYCKKVRDDKNYWHQVENYITHHTGVRVTHGICPTCFQAQMEELGRIAPEAPGTSTAV